MLLELTASHLRHSRDRGIGPKRQGCHLVSMGSRGEINTLNYKRNLNRRKAFCVVCLEEGNTRGIPWYDQSINASIDWLIDTCAWQEDNLCSLSENTFAAGEGGATICHAKHALGHQSQIRAGAGGGVVINKVWLNTQKVYHSHNLKEALKYTHKDSTDEQQEVNQWKVQNICKYSQLGFMQICW